MIYDVITCQPPMHDDGGCVVVVVVVAVHGALIQPL